MDNIVEPFFAYGPLFTCYRHGGPLHTKNSLKRVTTTPKSCQ